VRLGRAEAAMILASALRRAVFGCPTALSQGLLPKRIGCAPTEADAAQPTDLLAEKGPLATLPRGVTLEASFSRLFPRRTPQNSAWLQIKAILLAMISLVLQSAGHAHR
jgi:hypothetical protein